MTAHSLEGVALRTSYHKGVDDIARDFYLPCMRRAVRYDRAVGFFRSTIFAIAWPALQEFVERGGTIRILCSHVLAEPDVGALEEGYEARLDERLSRHYIEEIRQLLQEPALRDPVRVLAALVATGVIDLKVAVLRASETSSAVGRIFHDKLGIFFDDAGHAVIFKGSMNETWQGLAADGNLESVDVAATWLGDRDNQRVETELGYFAALWEDRYPGLLVRPFPAVARSELEGLASHEWKEELKSSLTAPPITPDTRGRTLRPHQAAGLAGWRANGRRGILEFATGSGKTFTAITAIRESLVEHGEVVLVVVPDRVLLGQWYDELTETTRDIGASVVRAGAGYGSWKTALADWMRPDGARRVVLATIQTAAKPTFLQQIRATPQSLLVVDEVHRAGSPHHRALLDEARFAGARLGLSATPQRAGDIGGTAAILDFFRGILEPRYSLADAVRDGVLCRYFYRPHMVHLTREEQDRWDAASARIGQLTARLRSGGDPALAERLKKALIERARVVKQAEGKVSLAVQVLREHFRPSDRWLVYCDNLVQLRAVCTALNAMGLAPLPFHSEMDGDRKATLRWLDQEGGVVVAIKCLDEGVDVPSVSHALILASSKNPREFIQRRGRVLRRSPGKSLAFIHDAIVVPSTRGTGADPDPITTGEMARAIGFATQADNPSAAADLHAIAIDTGIDWRRLQGAGIEDDDDDES